MVGGESERDPLVAIAAVTKRRHRALDNKEGFRAAHLLVLFLFGIPALCVVGLTLPNNGFSSATTMTTKPTKDEESIKLSLWMMVPSLDSNEDSNESNASNGSSTVGAEAVQTQIDDWARTYHGPTFLPHVTLVGGIPAQSVDDAHTLAANLQAGLANFGSVEILLGDILREPTQWNQALIVEVEQSASFLSLCRTSRSILGMPVDDCYLFPPPANVPHMSLYYGVPPNVPRLDGDANDDKEGLVVNAAIPHGSFQATTLMLWITNPSTLDGVPDWKPVATIKLV